MRFGTFGAFRRCPGELDDAQYFGRARAEVQYAETLGYDDAWLAEAYFLNVLGISSLQQATWLAGLTSKIRLGTAIVAMPLHNPLEVAIMAANADHLTGGRLDLGFGRGFSALFCPDLTDGKYPGWSDGFIGLGNPKSRPSEFPKDGLQGKYLESISCVKGLLENEQFTFKGDYYEYDGVWMYPHPVQKPLPLWAVAQSLNSYEEMGRRGFNLLFPLPGYHRNFQDWEGTAEALGRYRAAWKEAGHPGDPEVILRAQFCLSRTKDEAWAIAQEAYSTITAESVLGESPLGKTLGVPTSVLQEGFLGGGSNPNVQAMKTLSLDEVIDQVTITGTPEYALEQVHKIREAFGVSGVIVEAITTLNSRRGDYWDTMQLFADEVIPHFK